MITTVALLSVEDLPVLNAVLNSIATVLLLLAFSKIRQKKISEHRRLMIAAFTVSCLFLASYLTYHYLAGVVYFTKQGWVRTTYLWILTTHTILAVIVPFLAILTF